MWILLALASAATFGIVSVIDKRLLDQHLPSVSALYLWIALVLSFCAVMVLAITGLPLDAPPDLLIMNFVSGLGIGGGLALMFAGLKLDEASRAVAITQTNPVFVALLAVPLLGEALTLTQWLAMVLVVVGGTLISLRSVPNRRLLGFTRGTPLLIGSSLSLAVGFLAAKYALAGLSVWTVFSLQQLGVVAVFALFARPRVWREVASSLRDRRTLILLLVGEGMLPIVAIILSLFATSLGPVSLVTAFLATRPLFVFVAITILSSAPWHIMEESLSRGTLALKFTSILLIILGVGALGLG